MKLTREYLVDVLNRRRLAYADVPPAQMMLRYESIRKLVMLVAVVGALMVFGRMAARNVPIQGMRQIAVQGVNVGRTETPALAGASAVGATVLVVDSPGTDLEAAELAMVGRSAKSLDVAMSQFSDVELAKALTKLKTGGVAVRVYLGHAQRGPGEAGRLAALRELSSASVEVRAAPEGAGFGLASYAMDGSLLRTGASVWSADALRGSDSGGEIVYVESRAAVARFEGKFDELWNRGLVVPTH